MIIRSLGLQPYLPIWQNMQAFTRARTDATPDEIWLLEHEAVFTEGQNSQPEHLLNRQNTPVVRTDRGGQITWHGPGQLIVYLLVDLKRLKFTVRDFVCAIEQAVIKLLASYGLKASAKRDAPGVYINGQKICSLGLRIKRGCSYHGLALNLDPDLSSFQQINPCGYPGLQMIRLSDLVSPLNRTDLEKRLVDLIIAELGYNKSKLETEIQHAT